MMRYISFGYKDTHFAKNLTIYFIENAKILAILDITPKISQFIFAKMPKISKF